MNVHPIRPACTDCGGMHTAEDEKVAVEQLAELKAGKTPEELVRLAGTFELLAKALRKEAADMTVPDGYTDSGRPYYL